MPCERLPDDLHPAELLRDLFQVPLDGLFPGDPEPGLDRAQGRLARDSPALEDIVRVGRGHPLLRLAHLLPSEYSFRHQVLETNESEEHLLLVISVLGHLADEEVPLSRGKRYPVKLQGEGREGVFGAGQILEVF